MPNWSRYPRRNGVGVRSKLQEEVDDFCNRPSREGSRCTMLGSTSQSKLTAYVETPSTFAKRLTGDSERP